MPYPTFGCKSQYPMIMGLGRVKFGHARTGAHVPYDKRFLS